MVMDENWLPDSGCLPCPFQLSLHQSWGAISPWPGISKPGGGYFSFPLKTWYLPIQSCERNGQFSVGEINSADRDLFLAIAAHESYGHGNNNGPYFEFPRKQLIRMGAYIAYTALQEVTENAQDDKFWLVCGVNSAIGEITKSIALVEELFATLFGMELLREKNLIPSYTLNRIEDQFVQNHCEHFGPNFRNLYARLSQLYHMFGGEPLRLIAFFAAGDVDSANIVPLLYGDAHLIEAKSEERLDRALEFLERLQSTLSIEWEQVIFTGDWWHKVMYDLLPGYRESFTAYCPLLKTFQSIYEKVRVNSGNLDWNPLHPFLGGNRVLLYVHEPTSSSQLMIPYDLIRSNANALPEEVCEVIVQQFSQKFLRAHSNNRALVYLYNEEYESSEIPGIGVVPTVVEDTDELMPVPLYIPTYDLSSIENHARFDEWLRRREIAVAKMDKLFFYEGLRQQVAARCGLQCPLRGTTDQCCGEGELLLALFKAGQKAAANGWHYTKWEMPQECLRFASERI